MKSPFEKAADFDLDWFEKTSERKTFDKMGMGCVYAVGVANGPVKVGTTTSLVGRLDDIQAENHLRILVHGLLWAPDGALAARIERRVHDLFDQAKRRVRGSWFDVPVDMARASLRVAADALKIPVLTHTELVARVRDLTESRIQAQIAGI
jgi:hypothetical protein